MSPTTRRSSHTSTAAGESQGIWSAPNLRDIGGYPTRDGDRVRTGVVYRSSALHQLAGDDAAAFARLGIRTVYDLRSDPERQAQAEQLPPGTNYVVADVIGGAVRGGFAQLTEMLTDPALARDLLGDGRGISMWTELYRDFVRLDSARRAYGRLFTGIAGEVNRPALYHCSTGKDRTGWATAALLLLLDVPYELVMQDFLRSAVYLRPLVEPMTDAFAAQGGDPELLQPFLGIVPGYLDAARDEVSRSFGTIEGYFAVGLNVDATMQQALRETLLVRN
jgi:protein-tyrosine phosphatase